MTHITWNDFKVVLPRDHDAYMVDNLGRHVAYIIDDMVVWADTHVPPYSDFLLSGPITFSSVMVDVDGVETEAVHMTNGTDEYTVVCPEMITAMFLSDPEIIERFIEDSLDGQYVGPGWIIDRSKSLPDSRFYKEEKDMEGNTYKIWGNGQKETP